ncbi:MAG TPA: hypothetical protein VK823_27165 [Streptosporangiaceae bacterium]|nr:hypothetical protein [Streptosporangiaceae bacterium]
MIAAVAFTAAAAALCVAAVLALLGVAQARLSGSEALQRDGLAPGTRAPRWSLPDQDGNERTSPPAERRLQLVVFADHSLKSFPSVVDGLRELLAEGDEVEIVLLLRRPNAVAAPLLRELGLAGITVLTGSPGLYARYNVRVGPFLIFIDSAGLVRASSLVNYAWQVAKLRQLAGLPAEVGQP